MRKPSRLIGEWTGKYKLWLSQEAPPDESASSLVVSGEKGLRIEQTWSYKSKPQSGTMQVSIDGKSARMSWQDTFHTSGKEMMLNGRVGDDGTIDVRGIYAAPPGPDWGWRIEIICSAADSSQIVMYNIHPDGKEELAVRAEYTL